MTGIGIFGSAAVVLSESSWCRTEVPLLGILVHKSESLSAYQYANHNCSSKKEEQHKKGMQ